ncbi:MAG: RNA 2',3'-cyclic phosphodiesterase [Methylocystaceae bacterium]
MMRLFIALPVSVSIKRLIKAGIKEALKLQADVKWVEEENLHLTIKFIGEQPETIVPQLVSSLEPIKCPAFTLACTDIGCFPNRNRPRVIWLGLGEEVAVANQLAQIVDDRLAALGMAPESKRRWHLTLGRVRSNHNLDQLIPSLDNIFPTIKGEKWDVDSFSLFQSTLTSKGPIYQELHKFYLGH